MKWHQRSANMMNEAWSSYIENLSQSLDQLEKDIDEAKEMKQECSDEWCQATEHVIDELHKAAFSIHEPPFTDDQVSDRLRKLKGRIRDVYGDFQELAA